jgi:DNA-binding NtrC family response regulator
VRELRNLIERSLILGHYADDFAPTQPVELDLVDSVELVEKLTVAGSDAPPQAELLDEVERRHSLAVLANCGGNKTEAARRLGVSRKTLERKCALWNSR